jgi:hypothetical protein
MMLKLKDLIPCLACDELLEQQQQADEPIKAGTGKDYESFLAKLGKTSSYSSSSTALNEISKLDATRKVLEASLEDITSTLLKMVPCISCRLSAERLFKQLVPDVSPSTMSGCRNQTNVGVSLALDPIQINHMGVITLKPSLFTPLSLYTLFHIDRYLTSAFF